MSYETRPSVTRKTHPELETEYDEDEAREQLSQRKRRRNFLVGGLATTVAAAVAAGVLYLGANDDPEKTEPRAEPGTSAPANPGAETQPPAETTPPAAETNPANWTAENIPLYTDIDGDGKPETYAGQEALVQAFELSTAKYKDPDAAAAAFVGRMNTLINWGSDPKANKTYIDANVMSKDQEWGGTAAVREDYVIPAFNQAMFAPGENGVSIVNNQQESWMQGQIELARQTGARWAQSYENQHPYFLKFELDESRAGVEHIGGEEDKGYYQYWIDVKAVDNTAEAELPPELGAEPVTGAPTWSVALQRQGDSWKVIGVGNK